MRPAVPNFAVPPRPILGALAMIALAGSTTVAAQQPPGAAAMTAEVAAAPPHVMPGEEFTYLVRSSRFGTIGKGTMEVGGLVEVRGIPAYMLRFAFRTRVGPVRVVNETESWVDAADGALLRFHKHESHPLSSHDEAVELFPDEHRWENAAGETGRTPTGLPLDELSFIYFIRSLPLAPGAVYRVDRHFDAARNPSMVSVIGRDTLTTAAGVFPTIVVEVRVKDPRRYQGEGTLRFFLSDDSCRVPVRMVSTMPMAGTMTLELQSRLRGGDAVAARRP